jgi:hypothetical protein
VSEFESTGLSPETLAAAVEKMRDSSYEGAPPVMSPEAHDAVNGVLGRPLGSPITQVDVNHAVAILYDRATPEERERMARAAFGS